MGELHDDVHNTIRDVPDFPKPGILFKDITPVLADPVLFKRVIDWMAQQCEGHDIGAVIGIESRGFMFATPMVELLDAGFVPIRKKGKLPFETVGVSYDLEYGSAEIELHTDAFAPGTKVVIVDDLLATGGTAEAAVSLVRKLGGDVVACVFLIELGFLDGRKRIDAPVVSLLNY